MEPLEGLIASAGLFLSVTSIVVALSKDMYGGQYVDKLKMRGFVFDYQTPRASRLRNWLAKFPLVVIIAYIVAAIAVFVAISDNASCASCTIHVVEYVIHCLELVGLFFVLYLVRSSVLVRQERSSE